MELVYCTVYTVHCTVYIIVAWLQIKEFYIKLFVTDAELQMLQACCDLSYLDFLRQWFNVCWSHVLLNLFTGYNNICLPVHIVCCRPSKDTASIGGSGGHQHELQHHQEDESEEDEKEKSNWKIFLWVNCIPRTMDQGDFLFLSETWCLVFLNAGQCFMWLWEGLNFKSSDILSH